MQNNIKQELLYLKAKDTCTFRVAGQKYGHFIYITVITHCSEILKLFPPLRKFLQKKKKCLPKLHF